MSIVGDAVAYLNDPLNYQGPDGIPARLVEHLWISGLAVLLGCLVAWPVALYLGHRGRGGGAVVTLSNASRALPTLAVLTILSSIGAWFFGNSSVVIALAIFAVPPLLSNTFVGIRQVDPEVVDAARGMGLSGAQVLWRVELPLAVPLIAAGFRTAAVQVVATATLAALVGGGGLGYLINLGLGLQAYGQMLAAAVLVAALCLLLEGLLALLQRAVTPGRTTRPRRRRAADPALAG